jgi:hypothetical protein
MSPDAARDPYLSLYSVDTGEQGPHVVTILSDVHTMALQEVSKAIGLLDGGADLLLNIEFPIVVHFGETAYRQLRMREAAVRIVTMETVFVAQLHQSAIEIDRAKDLDFAVVVENYVTNRRLLTHRKTDASSPTFAMAADKPTTKNAEVLENDSILRVLMAPWIGLDAAAPNKRGHLNQVLHVTVDVLDGKPSLSLRAEPLAPAPAPA